jgi:hypothetical protein
MVIALCFVVLRMDHVVLKFNSNSATDFFFKFYLKVFSFNDMDAQLRSNHYFVRGG